MSTQSLTRVDHDLRTEFWLRVAETFNRPLGDHELAAVPALSDIAVIETCFSFLNDAERSEVLWALGQVVRESRQSGK